MNERQFAERWIKSWNSHDLDNILSHYTDDFEITTLMIKMALGLDTGTLKGKKAIGGYWAKALEKFPNLHFELYEAAGGVNSIVLYYKSVMEKKAIEVMFFNDESKVYKVIAHYTD